MVWGHPGHGSSGRGAGKALPSEYVFYPCRISRTSESQSLMLLRYPCKFPWMGHQLTKSCPWGGGEGTEHSDQKGHPETD